MDRKQQQRNPHNNNRNQRRFTNRSKNPNIICFNCNKPGHKAKDCRSTSFCFICNVHGHCVRDCNKNNSNQQQQRQQRNTLELRQQLQRIILQPQHVHEPAPLAVSIPHQDTITPPRIIKAVVRPNPICVVCNESFKLFSCHPHVVESSSKSTLLHHTTSCKSCWDQFIQEEINNRKVSSDGTIRCLDVNCHVRITQENLQHLTSTKTFEKYCHFMTLRAIQDTSDDMNSFRECVNASCKAVAEYPDGGPCIRCYKCGTHSCFNCRCLYHEGLSCEDYQWHQQLRDAASRKTLEDSTRVCPRCDERQWKSEEDCDIVTCRRCEYRFCFSCLADITVILTKDNSYHQPTCRHYRPRTNNEQNDFGRYIFNFGL